MPRDTTAEHRIELQRIWDALLRLALWKGVSFQDAEDLVSTSLRNALEHHDAARGAFLPFARTILCNGIKNYWRDRKTNLPIDDELQAHPDGEPDLVLEERERVESMKRTVEQLSQILSPEELSFMKTLGKVIEEIGERAVSETARRLGIAPTKGWDLFRRIQRKAHSLEAPAMQPPAIGRVAERAPAAAPSPPKKPQVEKRKRTTSIEASIDASIDSARPEAPMASDDGDFASYRALRILRATTAMKEEVGAAATEPLFAIAGAMAREEAFGRFLRRIGYPMSNL